MIEVCSEGGPTARHMVVEAPETDISLSCLSVDRPAKSGVCTQGMDISGSRRYSPAPGRSTTSVTPATDRSAGDFEENEIGAGVVGDGDGNGIVGYVSLLEQRADVKVTITILQPSTTASNRDSLTPPVARLPSSPADARRRIDSVEAAEEDSRSSSQQRVETQRYSTFSRRGGEEGGGRFTASDAEAFAGDGLSSGGNRDTSADARHGASHLPAATGGGQAEADHPEGRSEQHPPGSQSEAGSGRGARGAQERLFLIRISLPRLYFCLPPAGREAISGAISRNILAAGFHGNAFENFPLDVDYAFEKGHEDGVAGGGRAFAVGVPDGASSANDAHIGVTTRGDLGHIAAPRAVYTRHSSFHSSSNAGSRTDGGGRAAAAVACTSCSVEFEDDLVGRHRCAWCGNVVCRKCLHTKVRLFLLLSVSRLACLAVKWWMHVGNTVP